MLSQINVFFVSYGIRRREKQRKLWKDEDMVAALESVNKKEMTVAQAATTYNVPRKTFNDRVKGWVVHGTNPG